MRHYEFNITSTDDDFILISQSGNGYDRDDRILIHPDQAESFISGIRVTANSIKRDASRKEGAP